MITGDTLELREIEIGGYNDEFVEIRSGLKEGERVSLAAISPDTAPKPATSPATRQDTALTNGVSPLVQRE